MKYNDDKSAVKLVGILAGLALGQGIIFLIVNPDGWQIIDKALFGLGIGVGFAGLFYAVLDLSTKQKNN